MYNKAMFGCMTEESSQRHERQRARMVRLAGTPSGGLTQG